MENNLNKAEVISILLRTSLLFGFSYFALKYLVVKLDPTNQQKKDAKKKADRLLERLSIQNLKSSLNEYELSIAAQLIDPSSIDVTWRDVAGLENIIDDITSTVILPIRNPELFKKSNLHQPPKGVLLHGPPGCGKTMLAKATAKEAGARFINLEVPLLTDKWYGESQKLAKAVFTLAVKLQPCIIFIDEIDSFLRSRDTNDHEATAMMKAQFMILWDGLISQRHCQVIVMGATNRPQDVDKAILRRMPSMFSIGLPNAQKRKEILKLILLNESLDYNVDLDRIAELTDEFSGSDLRELCRASSLARVKEYVQNCPISSEQINRETASDSKKATSKSGLTIQANSDCRANSSSSSTSSIDNYSLMSGNGHQPFNASTPLRPMKMEDFLTVIHKMLESKRHLGSGNGHSVIGLD